MLKDQLRETLIELAQTRDFITYKELADRLKLAPPQTIHRLTEALEMLMADDVDAGRPILAALCVGRLGSGLPARGFFIAAKALGVFMGNTEGPEAQDFHVYELRRVLDFYRQT